MKDRHLAAMTLQVHAIVEGSVLQRAGIGKGISSTVIKVATYHNSVLLLPFSLFY